MTKPQDYQRPNTLLEAASLLTEPGTAAVCGGALLLAGLEVPYERVIDLQALPDFNTIEPFEGGVRCAGGVRLEALTTLRALPLVVRRALTRALPLNLRAGISVHDSLLLPAAPLLREWWAILAAIDVTTHWLTPHGERATLTIGELLAHYEEGSPAPGILLQLEFAEASGFRHLYGSAFVARSPSDVPIVNAAVYVRLDAEETVDMLFGAVCGASSAPVALVTLPVEPHQPYAELDTAALLSGVGNQLEPEDDWLGSAEYRRAMALVCLQRALDECKSSAALSADKAG